jgi:hypothetical protein
MALKLIPTSQEEVDIPVDETGLENVEDIFFVHFSRTKNIN